MRGVNADVCPWTAVVGLLLSAACSGPSTNQTLAPAAANITAFEGARLIVGDGAAPIENAAFVVENDRFVQVGRAGEVRVPAGATRVNLARR